LSLAFGEHFFDLSQITCLSALAAFELAMLASQNWSILRWISRVVTALKARNDALIAWVLIEYHRLTAASLQL